MQLKTILNRVQKHKSFVYGAVRIREAEGGPALEIKIQARANGQALCSGCGQKRPGYDRLKPRRYEFVPLWGMAVYFVYALRRVSCPACGVKVEQVPWARGKSRLTTTYQWFLARWARLLAWQQVSEAFGTSWDSVYRSVAMAVAWGMAQRSLAEIKAIGVDEIQWQKGHRYLTLVYQINDGCKRLLYIGAERTEKSLEGFFVMLGRRRSRALRFVCSDMWKPYLNVIAAKASQAIHVLDRFHIILWSS